MDWNELRDVIGDRAKDIILTDRCAGNDKPTCFMTIHKKGDVRISWFADGLKLLCHDCNEKYDIIDHVKYLANDDNKKAYEILCEIAGIKGDFASPKKTPDEIETPDIKEAPVTKKMVQVYPKVNVLSKQLSVQAKQYLSERGISNQTLIDYKVTSDEQAIYFNYLAGGHVVKIKGRAIGDMDNGQNKYCFTPKGGTNVLYGQHLHSGQRTLAICEGEIDALSLHEALKQEGIQGHILATSVPSGSSSFTWIETSAEFISRFDNVIIVPDDDEAGKKFSAQASCKLMMMKLVKVCDITATGCNDVNHILQEYGFKPIINMVGSASEFIPDFTVDLAKVKRDEQTGYSKSGFFMLDKCLRGFRNGLITLLTGHSGDGKTTLLRQMVAFNAASKNRIGVIMGEETASTFIDMILEQTFIGTHPNHFAEESDEWYNKSSIPNDEVIKLFREGFAPYIGMFDTRHLSKIDRMTKIYEWIQYENTIYGTTLFVIDNLMKLEVGVGDNLNSVQGDIIDALKSMCTAKNIHIIIVAHPNKASAVITPNSVSGSKKIINTVDNVVIFQRFDTLDKSTSDSLRTQVNEDGMYDNITAYMKVCKNRFYGILSTIPMRYNQETRSINDLNPFNMKTYGYTIQAREINPGEYYEE
jgi:hypothetical protein